MNYDENILDYLNPDSGGDDETAQDSPMDHLTALRFLYDYLLPTGWYTLTAKNQWQVNTEAVLEILEEHSKQFRHELFVWKCIHMEDSELPWPYRVYMFFHRDVYEKRVLYWYQRRHGRRTT